MQTDNGRIVCRRARPFLAAMCMAFAPLVCAADSPAAATPPTMTEVLAASKASDWHPLDPENTLYLELAGGRVIIELSPAFSPRHTANIKALVREK